MTSYPVRNLDALLFALMTACVEAVPEGSTPDLTLVQTPDTISTPASNQAGAAATVNALGVDPRNPFHQALGRNGRSCATCHLPSAGWSVTPAQIEELFTATQGTDPLFIPFDANNENADVSTREARYASYSMLRKGLFRRGGPVPATREFDIVDVDLPTEIAPVDSGRITVFRRPLATANLQLTKNIGWDDNNTRDGQTSSEAQRTQADFLIRTNLMAPTPTPELLDSIVDYQSAIWFAQTSVLGVGALDACGARGGPVHLAAQQLLIGPFDLFDGWSAAKVAPECASAGRTAIARGQVLFNTKPSAGSYTCSDCHSAQNNGSNASGATFNIGVSHAVWASVDGLPIYTIRHRATGAEVRTTDPGKAIRTGLWLDVNHFKVPSLRGLSARAPYFHNGFAKTLIDVVRFYERSLGFSFSASEESDLVAFLGAL